MNSTKLKYVLPALLSAVLLSACGSSTATAPETSTETTQEQSATTAEETAEEAQTEESQEEVQEEAEAPIVQSDYEVTSDGVRVAEDWEGNPAVVVSLTYTNNSEETTSFAATLMVQVFQNGISRDIAILMDGNENDNYLTDIRPGTTIAIDLPYELEDMSDIEVEVTELFSFSNDKLAEATFSLS